jgi:predicted metal-dependent peptidase
MNSQTERIKKARMDIILSDPFFGSLLMRLSMVEDAGIPTFCTNGKWIKFNPGFSARLNDAELRGVLVHEVMHVALGHHLRRDGRDPMIWNMAADYAINNHLMEYSYRRAGAHISLPSGGLVDKKYKDMSAEQIYAKIATNSQSPKEQGQGQSQDGEEGESQSQGQGQGQAQGQEQGKGKGQGQGQGQGQGLGQGQGQKAKESGKGGSGRDHPSEGMVEDYPGDKAEMEEAKAELQSALSVAATLAKAQGKLPGFMERLVGEMLKPAIPWQEVLRQFVNCRIRDDYSWSRPNPRYMPYGYFLPSMDSECVGHIVTVIDTSGSISNEELAQFIGEIQAIMDDCKPVKLTVMYADARVNHIDEYEPGDQITPRAVGGGGTDFRPAIKAACELPEPPECIIYLTDGCGEFGKPPPIPILWVLTSSINPPFGDSTRIR